MDEPLPRAQVEALRMLEAGGQLERWKGGRWAPSDAATDDEGKPLAYVGAKAVIGLLEVELVQKRPGSEGRYAPIVLTDAGWHALARYGRKRKVGT